jgi:hypothetical protein
LHASLATDAAVVIEIYNPVSAPVQCSRRANLDAGSVVAVVAAEDAKMPASMWKLALLDVFHPGSKHTHWNLVFFLAGYSASMTSDAAVLVDYKAVTHKIKGNPNPRWDGNGNRRTLHATARYFEDFSG